MKNIVKLHTYCNDTFYGFMCSCTLTSKTLLRLASLFKELSKPIEAQHRLVTVEPLGIFRAFTDDFCNGMVQETSDHPLLGIDDEEVRPWQKYDYVHKKYVDWYGPLMAKGKDDEEFKKAYAFSYRASFQSSLMNAGIKEEDVDNTYVFKVFDCRDDFQENPFRLPTMLIKKVESLPFIKKIP